MNPTVSVIMGVYNCAPTLPDAIESILAQSMTDWEFIICDDGSTDQSWQIATEYSKRDERIVLLQNAQNLGLNETLNKCLAAARGKYIARMDGDDRCPADRFEAELCFLRDHPDYALVSGWMECYDARGTYGVIQYREMPQYADLVRGSQFCHAGSMLRADVLAMLGGYRSTSDTERVEDYDLWVRLYAAGYKGYNLQRVVYSMCDDRNAFRRRKLKYRINESKVSYRVYRDCHLPLGMIRYTVIPICKVLIPQWAYGWLHKRRMSSK